MDGVARRVVALFLLGSRWNVGWRGCLLMDSIACEYFQHVFVVSVYVGG